MHWKNSIKNHIIRILKFCLRSKTFPEYRDRDRAKKIIYDFEIDLLYHFYMYQMLQSRFLCRKKIVYIL
uniref:Uncharacterized protein n=1 Tax=Pararge aegeria TaxID=116150 RepID=S4PF33_9NEOP